MNDVLLSILIYGGLFCLVWWYRNTRIRYHREQRDRPELKKAWELGRRRGYRTKGHARNEIPVAFEEESPASSEVEYSRTVSFNDGFRIGKQKKMEEELAAELAQD